MIEAQECHAAAFEAVRPELLHTAGDGAVGASERPASRGAEIEGKNGRSIAAKQFCGGIVRPRRQRWCGGFHNEGSQDVGLRLWSDRILESRNQHARKFVAADDEFARASDYSYVTNLCDGR